MRKKNAYSYKDDLLADLKDLDYAAMYLSTAMRDSPEVFLIALRDVAEAQKGMAKLAVEAQVNRENLYRMLSDQGNPRLDTLNAVLRGVGLMISIQAEGAPSVEPAPAKAAAGTARRRLVASNHHVKPGAGERARLAARR